MQTNAAALATRVDTLEANPLTGIGHRLSNPAQRVGFAVDQGARFAKRVFGVISPALRELGIITGGVDRVADKAFTGYSQLRDKVLHGNEVLGRTAGRLAGLPM